MGIYLDVGMLWRWGVLLLDRQRRKNICLGRAKLKWEEEEKSFAAADDDDDGWLDEQK